MIGTLTRLGQSHRGYSQREKVVRFLLLRPGWHSIHAIHREVGFCRLNSRVAEARKVFRRDGHPFDIKHSIRDGQHGYELVPLEAGACADPSRGAGAHASSGSNLIPGLGLPHAQDGDGPLVLEGQGQLL